MLQIPTSGTDNSCWFAHRTGFRFTTSDYVDELIAALRVLEADILILDPLQKMMPGLDSNSDSDTGVVWDEVFRIQQAFPNLVVLIVHHANKTRRLEWESIRGSSRHAGEVDLGIFLERHPVEEETLRLWMDGRDIPQYLGTGEYFEVKYKIDRDEMTFEMDAREISVDVHAAPQLRSHANENSVLEAVREGYDTKAKIASEIGLGDNTVQKHLKTLVESGQVIEHDNGKGFAKTYTAKEDEDETENLEGTLGEEREGDTSS
jgi:biotin operon repressor